MTGRFLDAGAGACSAGFAGSSVLLLVWRRRDDDRRSGCRRHDRLTTPPPRHDGRHLAGFRSQTTGFAGSSQSTL